MSSDQILIVCTANVCRSPFVEAVLRGRFSMGANPDMIVESAGTRARPGEPMAHGSAAMLREMGIAPDPGFAARQLSPAMIASADVILTMTREHRGQVLDLVPAALRKVLTLKELARFAPSPTTDAAPAWPEAAAGAIAERGNHREIANSLELDLADPFGQDREAFERMQRDVVGIVAQLRERRLLP
ncbi:low molecular weight phosphotyrosine protein phosphatase [Leucobacter aridicollis]|uniref:Protein-tyrosine phosphatase n=1 Tax=Leucobacter aridicollis TaxID=283878 RepID=A0A852R0M0_9MICO|nr:low molecular weight phosphotyrosine protein phosphatase [Leucobacter aridicollis]MBL3683478.1 low molecular weight phosphotyrosine protein phosphatase [Leucobacter aridicollis]NYD25215.1 protein-tyrosine phosphatase [Leucobacter aridicollis]